MWFRRKPIYSEIQQNFLQVNNNFRMYSDFGEKFYMTEQSIGIFFQIILVRVNMPFLTVQTVFLNVVPS